MCSDKMIMFEEDNWDLLAEKFIKKYQDKWEEFVYTEFMDNVEEPLDMD